MSLALDLVIKDYLKLMIIDGELEKIYNEN